MAALAQTVEAARHERRRAEEVSSAWRRRMPRCDARSRSRAQTTTLEQLDPTRPPARMPTSTSPTANRNLAVRTRR
eukprot:12271-Prymnesium_polylepis.1